MLPFANVLRLARWMKIDVDNLSDDEIIEAVFWECY